MIKTDLYRLKRIVETGRALLTVVEEEGVTQQRLESEIRVQWMVSTPLFDLGEQANCLSEEFVNEHTEIPWSGIAGMRHRLVHDYEGANWKIVGQVIFEELEPLLGQVEEIIATMEPSTPA